MEKWLQKKLEKIIEGEERELLRNLLEEVFLNLYQYSDEQYKMLEKRVLEEIDPFKQSYTVYTSLAERKDYDKTDSFLFPIHPFDLEKRVYHLKEIKECLQKKERFFVFSLFMECDYLLIKKLLKNKKNWKGIIITDRKEYKAYFEIEADTSYEKEIEELYTIFIENKIPWLPIFFPYVKKMIQVFLIGCEEGFLEEEEIKEIRVDFAEYLSYIKKEKVPLWNIKPIQLKTTGFAYPIGGEKRYEHKISLRKEGIAHNYLAVCLNNCFSSIRRSKEYLYVVAQTQESMIWEIRKIVNPILEKKKYYPLLTNAKKDSFSREYTKQSLFPIRTKIEIERFLNSFEVTKGLILEEIFFTEEAGEKETYCLEPFIKEEIRKNRKKERMVFVFHGEKTSYLTRDILSFFVAQIQNYFPEYDCEGKLV